MPTALLIVDVQNDYFEGGSMPLVGMDHAAEQVAALLARFRDAEAPLVHVQHLAARPGATFFVPGTEGAEIHASVTPAEDEPVITKHFPSAFRDTDLDSRLRARGIDSLVICGAMTHMCIDTTVRAAFDLGYACTVAADACATRDLEYNGHAVAARDVQSAFLAALAMPFAAVKPGSEITP